MQKNIMGKNFLASFVAVAGSIITYHFDIINNLQGECPLILIYSRSSGTGKILVFCYVLSKQ